jgi:hypothetical protein
MAAENVSETLGGLDAPCYNQKTLFNVLSAQVLTRREP